MGRVERLGRLARGRLGRPPVLGRDEEHPETEPHQEKDEDQHSAELPYEVDHDQEERHDEADDEEPRDAGHGAGSLDDLVPLKVCDAPRPGGEYMPKAHGHAVA